MSKRFLILPAPVDIPPRYLRYHCIIPSASVLSISSHSTILQYSDSHLLCTVYRYPHLHATSLPSRYFSIIVFSKHSHSHSIRIRILFRFPFNDTRYQLALLLQRHEIPSHYSASSRSFDSYSLIPRSSMHPSWIDRWANVRTLFLSYPIPLQHGCFDAPPQLRYHCIRPAKPLEYTFARYSYSQYFNSFRSRDYETARQLD
jgi:hypothetical protein